MIKLTDSGNPSWNSKGRMSTLHLGSGRWWRYPTELRLRLLSHRSALIVAAQLFSRSFQVEKCNLDQLHFNGYSLSSDAGKCHGSVWIQNDKVDLERERETEWESGLYSSQGTANESLVELGLTWTSWLLGFEAVPPKRWLQATCIAFALLWSREVTVRTTQEMITCRLHCIGSHDGLPYCLIHISCL